MNQLVIIGNLTRDPNLRQVNTANGFVDVCDFTVAVNRRQKGKNEQQEADFFKVTAWRGLGTSCSKYLAKGRKVMVTGPVSVSTYQGQDGTTRASMEINAQDVEFLSSSGNGAQNGNTAVTEASGAGDSAAFTSVQTEELPF